MKPPAWSAGLVSSSVFSAPGGSNRSAQSGNLKHAIFDAMRKTLARTTKKSALKIAAAAAKRERKAKARESASASS